MNTSFFTSYRIYHLATLPRNDWRRLRTDKKPQLTWHTSSYSPEDNGIPEDSTDVREGERERGEGEEGERERGDKRIRKIQSYFLASLYLCPPLLSFSTSLLQSLPSLTVHDKSPPAISPVQSDPIMMSASDSPQLSDTVTQSMDYHSVGLEALEMLHNQLEILVREKQEDLYSIQSINFTTSNR